jgi:SAM-dependent methyltransferase
VLTVLERVVPALPGRPELAGPDHPMRAITRAIAEGGGWSPARAAKVAALFDDLASQWHERATPERLDPLVDALERGGVARGGSCVEVGSGTGIATPVLAGHFGAVACVDLSREMLVRAPAEPGARILADAAALPVRTGSARAVVLLNAFLFPAEVDRVLAAGGAVVWVSALGDRTPIYLPPEDVVAALPGAWRAVAADAGWGSWLVATRC